MSGPGTNPLQIRRDDCTLKICQGGAGEKIGSTLNHLETKNLSFAKDLKFTSFSTKKAELETDLPSSSAYSSLTFCPQDNW